MLSTVLNKRSGNSPVIITIAMSVLFVVSVTSSPRALPNAWHAGSQSLPGKHVTECRVVILTSLVSPPTA